jgi:hypothetical protein
MTLSIGYGNDASRKGNQMKPQIQICRSIQKSVLPELKKYLDSLCLTITEIKDDEFDDSLVYDVVIVVKPGFKVELGSFRNGLVRGWLDAKSPAIA